FLSAVVFMFFCPRIIVPVQWVEYNRAAAATPDATDDYGREAWAQTGPHGIGPFVSRRREFSQARLCQTQATPVNIFFACGGFFLDLRMTHHRVARQNESVGPDQAESASGNATVRGATGRPLVESASPKKHARCREFTACARPGKEGN